MALAPSPLLDQLLGDAPMQALLSDEAQIKRMLAFERELARAEGAAGLTPANAASAIAALLATFTPDWSRLGAGMAKDGVVVPELVRQIKAALPQHADFVHAGATSQDAIDTATMLAIKEAIALLADGLDRVLNAIAAHAASAGARPMMAHTRMQRAMEFTIGDKLESWSAPLRRQRAALAELARTLPVLQLGGPVGDRAWLSDKADAVAASLATALGLNAAPPWQSQRDRIAGFGAWLALMSGSLGKIGADIALLAQNEIGAVTIVGGGSSSAMAHKSNPVAAEMLVTLAHYNAGLSGMLQGAMIHENERSGAAWTLEWLVLPEMLVATAAGLRLGEELLGALTFKTAG